jgi:hypothetical protein
MEYTAFMRTHPSLEAFENELRKYMDLENQIMDLPTMFTVGCICLESSPVKDSLRAEAVAWRSQFTNNLHEQVLMYMYVCIRRVCMYVCMRDYGLADYVYCWMCMSGACERLA